MNYMVNTRSFYYYSLLYALIAHFGFLGYGIDVYDAYSIAYGWGIGTFEPIGWYLSTFRLYSANDIYLGVFFVSLIVSSGLIYASFYFLGNENKFSKIEIIFIIFFMHFVHVTVFSSVNALRQGLAMSFFMFGIVKLLSGSFRKTLFLFLLSILCHNAVLFIIVPLLTLINVNKKLLQLGIGFIFIVLTPFALNLGVAEKTQVSTTLNYSIIYFILFFAYSFFYWQSFSNSTKFKFSEVRRRYQFGFFVVMLMMLFLLNRESHLQRMVMFIMIPLVYEIFVFLPAINPLRNVIVFSFLLLWVVITLTSSAFSSFREYSTMPL
uniref:EpsG family protein n=1 Tax=Chlorobium chlorochromatii (strain CaD3) TaxID=340177 RepID=Q3ASS8_CHLCH